MNIDIKYPVLARATPATSRKGERYFLGSMTHAADIPEYSLLETEVAVDRIAVTSDARQEVFPALRRLDGRLLRPLGSAKGLFERAHPDHIADYPRGAGEYMVTEPMRDGLAPYPAAYAPARWIKWFIDLHGMDTERGSRLWPERKSARGPDGHWAWDVDRNLIEVGLAELRDVNADDLDLCTRMADAQTRRLVSLSGQLWIETTMPCVSVTVSGDPARANQEVKMDVGFLPAWCDHKGGTLRFPLSRLDEAVATYRDLAPRFGREDRNTAVRVEFADGDVSAADFDQEEEEAHAMALALGSNLVRRAEQHVFHKHHQNAPPLFSGTRLALYEHLSDLVKSDNAVIGERSDLVSRVHDIHDLWVSVKKPRYDGLGAPPTHSLDYFVERGLRQADNCAISVPYVAPGADVPAVR